MALPMSDYERRRQANIADNKRILAALGLLDPLNDKPTLEFILDLKKRKRDDDAEPQPAKKRVKKDKVVLSEVKTDNVDYSSSGRPVRRSSRRMGKTPAESDLDNSMELDEDDDGENTKPKFKVQPNREKFYGPVEGVPIGTCYETRLEFCYANVHRPTVAGIHGGPDGAYSIALSGGYEDDIDRGEFFTYTGEGGRDLKGTSAKPKNLRTAPQSKDQTLTRGNLALSRNVETGNPVRVIRGYKLKSPYAPEEGYRYDGLYTVEKSWFTTGLSGFGVWKFAMKRCADQPPPPWKYVGDSAALQEDVSSSLQRPSPPASFKTQNAEKPDLPSAKVTDDANKRPRIESDESSSYSESSDEDDASSSEKKRPVRQDLQESDEVKKEGDALKIENPSEIDCPMDDHSENAITSAEAEPELENVKVQVQPVVDGAKMEGQSDVQTSDSVEGMDTDKTDIPTQEMEPQGPTTDSDVADCQIHQTDASDSVESAKDEGHSSVRNDREISPESEHQPEPTPETEKDCQQEGETCQTQSLENHGVQAEPTSEQTTIVVQQKQQDEKSTAEDGAIDSADRSVPIASDTDPTETICGEVSADTTGPTMDHIANTDLNGLDNNEKPSETESATAIDIRSEAAVATETCPAGRPDLSESASGPGNDDPSLDKNPSDPLCDESNPTTELIETKVESDFPSREMDITNKETTISTSGTVDEPAAHADK